MDSLTYLKSPINTLLESVENDSNCISCYDLLEAYHTIAIRIRSQSHVIASSDGTLLALHPLEVHSTEILRALRRDMRRTLLDPSNKYTFATSVDESSTKTNYGNPGVEMLKHAKDLVSLCHHALRVVSLIFKFSSLYSIFDSTDLRNLLGDLLELTHTPTPNTGKTLVIIIWILQSQRLPISILRPKMSHISSTLKLAVQGENDRQEILLDGLKAIEHFLKSHSFRFLLLCSDILPSILPHLVSPSLDIRLQAARTLNAFVSAKVNAPPLAIRKCLFPISYYVRSFIDGQVTSWGSSEHEISLQEIINRALTLDTVCHPGQGPFWALDVLACLIVLSDCLLFSHSRSLKFFLPTLAQTRIHRHSAVRSLHPQVWNCLVWALSRLPWLRDHGGVQPEDLALDIEEPAFLLVKQELNGSIGVSLAISLLAPHHAQSKNTHAVSKVLSIVDDMVCSISASTRKEGILLFTRLLNARQTCHAKVNMDDTPNENTSLAANLFDDTLLDFSCDRSSTMPMFTDQPNTGDVRCFSEGEIVQHWDSFMSTWTKCIQRYLREVDLQSSVDILRILRPLLLALTHLSNTFDAGDHVFVDRVASLVSACFIEKSQALSPTEVEFRRLSLARQLWTVVQNVNSTCRISVLAEKILFDVLKRDFRVADADIQRAWSSLCFELVTAGDPALLDLISVQSQHQSEIEIRRRFWAVLAKNWVPSTERHWYHGIPLLVMPIGIWVMSDFETELWDGMLQRVHFLAGPESGMILENFMQRLGWDRLQHFPKLVLKILPLVTLANSEDIPTQTFQMIDNVLYNLYPPCPELLSTSLRFLRHLKDIIASASCSVAVPVLIILRKSLCRWIEDTSEVLLEEEYNDVIIPLYCHSLSMIQHHPPSLEILRSLGSLLASAFGRIPPPAFGPLAFETFWRATYHYQSPDFRKQYPENIKQCLRAFDVTFDSDLSANLTPGTDSQSQLTSIVPDSQRPHFLVIPSEQNSNRSRSSSDKS